VFGTAELALYPGAPMVARIPHAVLLLLLAWLAALAVNGIGHALARNSLEELCTSALALEITLALGACAAASLSRRPLRERLGLGPSALSRRDLAALVVGTLCISYALYGVLELTGLQEHSALPAFEAQLVGIRGGTLLFAIASFAVGAALGEELLCRGLLQWGLRSRVGVPAAILVSSLFFGAIHVDPVHAAFATFLGLYLGSAAQLANSVRASILCHGVNNLVAILMTAYAGDQGPAPPLAIAASFTVACGALALVARGRGHAAAAAAGTRADHPGLQPATGSDDA
jgi:membrane protease YdiL (CAAX protease family)